jgi:peptide/nickel transport system substrate-binding protein
VRSAAVGEWRIFDGEEYYYEGISDTLISITEDNTTILTFRLREDVFFSDGERMTADDIISTLYTLLNEDYKGQYAAISLLPIIGIDNYRTNANPEIFEKYAEILADGELSDEQTELYRECERLVWLAHVREIVDYCVNNYADSAYVIGGGDIYNDEWMQVALAMMVWRVADFYELIAATEEREAVFGSFTSISGREWDLTSRFPSLNDFYSEFYELYDGNLETYINAEKIGLPWLDNLPERAGRLFIREMAEQEHENSDVDYISGIRKISGYEVEVVLAGHIPAAVYSFVIPVAPRHHYGDIRTYDDSSAPVGAGPYKLIGFNNGVAALEANEFYFKGQPQVSEIYFTETSPDDLIYGTASGHLDIITVRASRDEAGEISAYSSAGIIVQQADYGAFGYIGFNAERMNVDGDPLSEQSIAFRKGIAVIMAAYRDISVRNYYEGAANVSEYPLSGVSWATPRRWDSGYRAAFGVDTAGLNIYDSGMSEARRLEAAKRTALGFFEAAGCELNAARTAIINVPEDVKSSYEVYVVGFGAGRHPSYLLLTMASDTLRTVGINIEIIDVSSQGEMYEAMFNGEADMWCAAWQGEVLPNINRAFSSRGTENFFRLSDELIDQRIDLAKTSLNLEFYRNSLEAVLDTAVIVPVYQRQMYTVFGSALDKNTIETELTAHYNWADIIWKIKIGG